MSGKADRTTEPSGIEQSMAGSFDLDCAFVEEHAEAFVLRALDLSDQQRVALHLRWCERCREITSGYVAIPRLLAESAPLADGPSPAVRVRLMERITSPQAQSETESRADDAAVRAPGASPAKAAANRLTVWQRRILPVAAAVLTVAFLLVSAWGIGLQNEIEGLRAQAGEPMTFSGQPLSSPRFFTTKPACTGCTGLAQLGADPGKSTAVLMAWGLDPTQTHEVWCMHENGESNRVAVLDVNRKGEVMQTLTFSQPIAGYLEIRIVKQHDASPELIFSVKHDLDEASIPVVFESAI